MASKNQAHWGDYNLIAHLIMAKDYLDPCLIDFKIEGGSELDLETRYRNGMAKHPDL